MRVKTGDGEETHARLLIYVAVNLIDWKTKYFKDRRGLEQKNGISGFLFPPFFFMLFRVNACGDNLL